MRSLNKRMIQMIQLNIKQILAFEILFRLFTLPAYLHLLDQALGFSLRMAGYSYLTAANIGLFLIRPWTIVCLLGVAVVGMVFLVIEIGSLLTAYQASVYGQRISLAAMFAGGVHKLIDEIYRKNVKLFLLALLDYTLTHCFLLYRILTYIRPVNFILRSVAEAPLGRLLLVLFLVLGLLLAVASMFVFHGCMIEQKSFRDSMKDSLRFSVQRLYRTGAWLFFYNVCITGLMIMLYLLAVLAAAVFMVLGPEEPGTLALLVAISDRIELVLIILTSAAAVIVNLAVVSAGYYSHREVQSLPAVYPDFSIKVNYRLAAGAVGLAAGIGAFLIYDMVYNGIALANHLWTEIGVTAHRGSSMDAPENTLEAVEIAIEQMADYAEIDVQLSADGVVILMHDSSLKRVARVNRRVSSMTWDELQQVDVGSWFSKEFEETRIPSLEQVMEASKGRINLNIELKNIGPDTKLASQVVQLIEDFEMEEQCVITSTRLGYLKFVKELNPHIRTGYIVSAAYGDYYSGDEIDFISLRASFVTPRLVEAVHELGKGVHAWTVNSKSELERMRMLGVDNVITDYPILAKDILFREEAKESLLEYLRLVFR